MTESEPKAHPISIIDKLNLDFYRALVLTYLSNYHSEKDLEDLKSAYHYLRLYILKCKEDRKNLESYIKLTNTYFDPQLLLLLPDIPRLEGLLSNIDAMIEQIEDSSHDKNNDKGSIDE